MTQVWRARGWTLTALLTAAVAAGCSGGEPPGANGSNGSTTGGPQTSARSGASARSSPSGSRGATGTITIGGSGDILAHNPVIASARANAGGAGYDFTPMFASVKQRLSALDVAICHQETPVSLDDTQLSAPRAMTFNAPREIAAALEDAGFDGCDRVSNHVMDRGVAGLAATARALSDAGLESQGPPAGATGSQQPVTYDAKGQQVAQLAYTYTLENAGSPNTAVPAQAPWLRAWSWPVVGTAGILADAHRAKKDGADIVVISMHWGQEYQTEATPQQRAMAAQLLASPDVDVILGTHTHVPQPCEKIHGKYVVYGMGNFLSNQAPEVNPGLRQQTQDGMIVDVAVTTNADGTRSQTLRYQPTHVVIAGHRIEPATKTQHPDAYRRVVAAMTQLGSRCDAVPEG